MWRDTSPSYYSRLAFISLEAPDCAATIRVVTQTEPYFIRDIVKGFESVLLSTGQNGM